MLRGWNSANGSSSGSLATGRASRRPINVARGRRARAIRHHRVQEADHVRTPDRDAPTHREAAMALLVGRAEGRVELGLIGRAFSPNDGTQHLARAGAKIV